MKIKNRRNLMILAVFKCFEYLFSGLNGSAIEPLVPLLTFIGSIDLDKSVDLKHLREKANMPLSTHIPNKSPFGKSTGDKKKKGLRR